MKNFSNLKEKIKIVDVISNFINLNKKGKNFIGLCPFHEDKNPSMSISEEKNIFKCFVCGESGNAVSFIMKYENINFNEAFLKALNLSGVDLKNYKNFSKIYEKNKEIDNLYSLTNLIADSYNKFLFNKDYKNILDYLINDRKLTLDLIKKFKIGFAPKFNSKDLTIQLIEKENLKNKTNFKRDDLEKIGLSLISQYGSNYDFFSNRIIFPIYNENNNIVGYSGRILENDKSESKYINSSESIIFKKSEILYNYNNLIKEKDRYEFLYLVEGFMDVISFQKIGILNTLASMGTSFSDYQINLLKKYFFKKNKKIILAFDNDNAGINFSYDTADKLLKNGFEVYIINFDFFNKKFKDIDEIISENNEKNISILKEPVNYFNWFIEKKIAGMKIIDVDDIKNIMQHCLEYFFKFSNQNINIKDAFSLSFFKKSLNEIYEIINQSKDKNFIKYEEERKDFLVDLFYKNNKYNPNDETNVFSINEINDFYYEQDLIFQEDKLDYSIQNNLEKNNFFQLDQLISEFNPVQRENFKKSLLITCYFLINNKKIINKLKKNKKIKYEIDIELLSEKSLLINNLIYKLFLFSTNQDEKLVFGSEKFGYDLLLLKDEIDLDEKSIILLEDINFTFIFYENKISKYFSEKYYLFYYYEFLSFILFLEHIYLNECSDNFFQVNKETAIKYAQKLIICKELDSNIKKTKWKLSKKI